MKDEINKFLAKLNLKIIRFNSSNTLDAFLIFLKKQNLIIDTIYDIGAHKGDWTNVAKKYFKKSNFFLFEPNSVHNSYLTKTLSPFFNIFLGEKNKTVIFHSANGTGDSKYPEFNPVLKPKEIKQVTLDSFVAKHSLPWPHFIKLDTQGSELDIIYGAKTVIKNCKIMILETPILKFNNGAPNQIDYLKFMRDLDYVPIYVTDIHRQKNCIIQMDFAFFRVDLYEELIGPISDIPFWSNF